MAFVEDPIEGSGALSDPIRLNTGARLIHCFQHQRWQGGSTLWFLEPYYDSGDATGAANFYAPFDVDVLEFWCMCSTSTDTVDFNLVSNETGAVVYAGTSDGPKSVTNTSYLTVTLTYTLTSPIPANSPFRVQMTTPMDSFDGMYTLRAIKLLV